MSEVRTFFRFCPECGRRFHIRLVSKKEVGSRSETLEKKQFYARGGLSMRGGASGVYPIGPAVLEETVPFTIEVEDFQYSYKCKHCGHEWTENRVEEKKEG